MFFNYVLIKGAGDLASGVACTLHRAGYQVVMTEIAEPTCVRRKVSFAEAVYANEMCIEGTWGKLAQNFDEAMELTMNGKVAVLVDPKGEILKTYRPLVFIDGAMIKKNYGTALSVAEIVIALGPGFEAGKDVHAVIETQRGSNLGKAIFQGTAAPNTGIPGNVLGYTSERVLRSPAAGVFSARLAIGDLVSQGEAVGFVDGVPVEAKISGTVRGLLKDGLKVVEGFKMGDIHPEANPEVCSRVTDKAWAIGKGTLQAIQTLEAAKKYDLMENNRSIFHRLGELSEAGKPAVVYTLVEAPSGLPLALGARLLVQPGGKALGTLGRMSIDHQMISRANRFFSGTLRDAGIVEVGIDMVDDQKIDQEVSGTEGEQKTSLSGNSQVKFFEDPVFPEKKLLVFGGGHVSVPLVEMAAMLGYRVTVVDDRPEFANRERFPWAFNVLCASFQDVFEKKMLQSDIDRFTSVVIVTRGHGYDRECLEYVLRFDPCYIGMIGSKGKVRASFNALLKQGISPEVLETVSAPIGLDLGGQTPAEIALSILAEMVARENGGTGKILKDLKGGVNYGEHV